MQPTTFDAVVKLANLLGGVSFATLLVIVLVGNKMRVWRWGEDFKELEARLNAEREDVEERMAAENRLAAEQVVFWRDIALRNTGLLETQAEQLMQVATQVGAVNKKLLSR
jgi:hypothetical protein